MKSIRADFENLHEPKRKRKPPPAIPTTTFKEGDKVTVFYEGGSVAEFTTVKRVETILRKRKSRVEVTTECGRVFDENGQCRRYCYGTSIRPTRPEDHDILAHQQKVSTTYRALGRVNAFVVRSMSHENLDAFLDLLGISTDTLTYEQKVLAAASRSVDLRGWPDEKLDTLADVSNAAWEHA